MASYVVRFGAMRFLGLFSGPDNSRFARGDKVILCTERGLEVGQILREADEAIRSQLASAPQGQILRIMTAEDANELRRIHAHEQEELEICQRYVDQLGLQMKLVDVEHIFGGERIIVYYLADARVDFRELVRQLAAEFKTRIEMRQIGVRDEAKLLADYGDCGCPVCCNTHLAVMPPVSMKMAKVQKSTLDPTKISGRCGRLKCCLRYEYPIYDEILQQLPTIGSQVSTPSGPGRVIGVEILPRRVLVETDDGVQRHFTPEEITVLVESRTPEAPEELLPE
ncbi:MAG TPA: regulatory iron-sulfur-containing complex subunit RicT [Thermoguttaceae bacterium]|nr:regulatory iron-sulfur-containing complex subunit RicT [Thermoguttaceae bacterium]HPP51580.1 regulatory iron-sulfur-containing complex subunit RicT [Thermoguttaceae bacterium]